MAATRRILSWNIRQGGGTRVGEIVGAIGGLEADYLVLSEFRDNVRGDELREGLEREGFGCQCFPEAPDNANSVLVAAKEEGPTAVFPAADPEYAHGVAMVHAGDFDLYGVYLPHKKKHQLFPFLFGQIGEGKPPAILAGDFNSGIDFIDQKGKGFWFQNEMRHLERVGYADAFRHLHGKEKEYSWFSHGGVGYRYDHSYVAKSLLPKVKACHYLHEWRERGLSDHSPMVVELV